MPVRTNHVEEGQLITREVAAERLGIGLRSLDRMIEHGTMPGVIHIGRGTVRIDATALARWVARAGRTMTIADVALYLGVTAKSVVELVKKVDLPAAGGPQAQLVFRQGQIDEWRKENEPPDMIFGNITHRAQVLKRELARHVNLELLECELCNAAKAKSPDVAAVKCFVCGRLCCLPHALHWLRNGKAITEDPDVACDNCNNQYKPATW